MRKYELLKAVLLYKKHKKALIQTYQGFFACIIIKEGDIRQIPRYRNNREARAGEE